MKPQCNTFPGNLYSKKHENLKHVFISWLLFSTFYWICAYYKPFHVDEFYSWVYAERCTFAEILRLKEFGIGHPPLYHLIQKMMQQVLPSYHFTYVRLANYLIGSLFVIIFVDGVLKYRKIPFFCYGVCCSATILDIFVFSRMWGLVCFSSLVLFRLGETYFNKRDRRYLIALLGICVFGFLSDYNFILIMPYVAIVLFSKRSYFKYFLPISLILLIIAYISSWHLHVIYKSLSYRLGIWHIFYDITKISYELGTVLFNFWFEEPFLAALFFFLLAMIIGFKSSDNEKQVNQDNRDASQWMVVGLFLFIFLNILISHGFFRIRFAAPIILLLLTFLFYKSRSMHILNMDIAKNRIIISIIGAILIVLCVNPLFWKRIISQRYVLILFPYLLFFVCFAFSKKVIHTTSVILAISGLVYISSNRMSGYFPSPSYDKDVPTIFQDEVSYSSQYIKNWKGISKEPLFIDISHFDKGCKICTMGKENIDFSNFKQIWVIGRYNFTPGLFLPSDFKLIRKIEFLTWLDQLQFKFMTPSDPTRQAAFLYSRVKSSQVGF